MANDEWFYAKSSAEQRRGPVTTAKLKELAENGTLSKEDLIWRDGMADWVPAGRTQGLFKGSDSVPPPPLPAAKASAPPPLPAARKSHDPSAKKKPGNALASGTEKQYVVAAGIAGVVLVIALISMCTIKPNRSGTATYDEPEPYRAESVRSPTVDTPPPSTPVLTTKYVIGDWWFQTSRAEGGRNVFMLRYHADGTVERKHYVEANGGNGPVTYSRGTWSCRGDQVTFQWAGSDPGVAAMRSANAQTMVGADGTTFTRLDQGVFDSFLRSDFLVGDWYFQKLDDQGGGSILLHRYHAGGQIEAKYCRVSNRTRGPVVAGNTGTWQLVGQQLTLQWPGRDPSNATVTAFKDGGWTDNEGATWRRAETGYYDSAQVTPSSHQQARPSQQGTMTAADQALWEWVKQEYPYSTEAEQRAFFEGHKIKRDADAKRRWMEQMLNQ